ncbi:MAG TPA: hypothetical protein VER83_00495 [Candidatus Nanopelagicales bacterium]|nr:hypothetical protein [Candidatus Nanopelagicales bacterium]
MTTPTAETPGERPPKRLLEQAPSERLLGQPGAAVHVDRAPPDTGAGAAARSLAFGLAAGAVGAAVHVAAATLLLWTGALLVVAVLLGILVGLAVALGAGRSMRPAARRSLAVTLAVIALAVAIGANWALSGMFLGLLDYLTQVYGLLVPLQAILAAAGAVAGSR